MNNPSLLFLRALRLAACVPQGPGWATGVHMAVVTLSGALTLPIEGVMGKGGARHVHPFYGIPAAPTGLENQIFSSAGCHPG